jgi:hypothetical protein
MSPTKELKKSFVWDYFSVVEPQAQPDGDGDGEQSRTVRACEEDVKILKCSLCTYTYKRKPKDSSTSCLIFHLLQKHNISKGSHERSLRERDGDGDLLHNVDTGRVYKQGQTRSIDSFFAAKNRSSEEWFTRQVVLNGLSLRQISDNEFQEAACIAMRLKHYKSASKVGEVVKNFIVNMKMETREELAKMEREGIRFSAVADEWTSNRNRQVLTMN